MIPLDILAHSSASRKQANYQKVRYHEQEATIGRLWMILVNKVRYNRFQQFLQVDQ